MNTALTGHRRNGVEDFLVLEAGDRIGGRIR